MHKNTICLRFDSDAEDAARFFAATFPDSRVTAVDQAPADYPSGKADDVRSGLIARVAIQDSATAQPNP